MSGIKNKNTSPEILVRKAVFKFGFRYKINDKSLPGSPDIVLPKYKTVIFVHGCFWHGHAQCNKSITPKTNLDFWKSKIEKNKKRDRKVNSDLKKLGWKIITVWDCKLINIKTHELTIDKIIRKITNAQL
jgi:DNA mismatch endonuclease (patch repair protein)